MSASDTATIPCEPNVVQPECAAVSPAVESSRVFESLLRHPAMPRRRVDLPSVVVGELIALIDNGLTPLIRYDKQPTEAALPARSMIDLHGRHIGRSLVLSFEDGNPELPVVMGLLRGAEPELDEAPGHVEIEADGARMVVSARRQLVLRCGRASITLTSAGKVLIDGTYVSSCAAGAQRIKGGSVQIN